MRSPAPATSPFERRLLRRGVRALDAVRRRCHGCRRTPLFGEEVFLYDGGHRLCALCAERRHETPLGSESVRSAEWGHAVRPAAAA